MSEVKKGVWNLSAKADVDQSFHEVDIERHRCEGTDETLFRTLDDVTRPQPWEFERFESLVDRTVRTPGYRSP